jgi:hypothetical protein
MHRVDQLLAQFTQTSLSSYSAPAIVNMADTNGTSAKADQPPQVVIDNWINGQPTKPLGGKYMPLWQPKDGTQTGQVALSGREVSLRGG